MQCIVNKMFILAMVKFNFINTVHVLLNNKYSSNISDDRQKSGHAAEMTVR